MKRRSHWRSRLIGGPNDPVLRSWLTEPGSLTKRCQAACRQFRVRLLRFERARALADEIGDTQAWVREVALECDGRPVIFAHTTLLAASRGRLGRWMARLGSRSLGSLLFSFPGFQRGQIEFLRLDCRHPLYRLAAAQAPVGAQLWARRSRHRLDGQEVLVTEVFLPAILQLSTQQQEINP